jgi:hypothetical protein
MEAFPQVNSRLDSRVDQDLIKDDPSWSIASGNSICRLDGFSERGGTDINGSVPDRWAPGRNDAL